MNDIKQFLEEFIQKEYIFNRAEYDLSVNDLECEALANEANIFFIESNSYNYTRVKSINDIRGNQKWEKRFQDKVQKIVPRILFQIKQYKNPKLGDRLKEIIVSDQIYACYLGYNQKQNYPVDYSYLLYVGGYKRRLKNYILSYFRY